MMGKKGALLSRSLLLGLGTALSLLSLILVAMFLFPSESLWFYVALERRFLLRNIILFTLATTVVVGLLHFAFTVVYERLKPSLER